jgi:phage shock protein E
MKHISLLFLTACLFVSCAQDGLNEREIVIDENTRVIDVRTEKEYTAGHLKNSINIPYGEIKETIGKYAHGKNEKIIVYCRSGRRSGIAKETLDEMGYTNVINAGAYEKLKNNAQERQKE